MEPQKKTFTEAIRLEKLDAHTYRADLDGSFAIGAGM